MPPLLACLIISNSAFQEFRSFPKGMVSGSRGVLRRHLRNRSSFFLLLLFRFSCSAFSFVLLPPGFLFFFLSSTHPLKPSLLYFSSQVSPSSQMPSEHPATTTFTVGPILLFSASLHLLTNQITMSLETCCSSRRKTRTCTRNGYRTTRSRRVLKTTGAVALNISHKSKRCSTIAGRTRIRIFNSPFWTASSPRGQVCNVSHLRAQREGPA